MAVTCYPYSPPRAVSVSPAPPAQTRAEKKAEYDRWQAETRAFVLRRAERHAKRTAKAADASNLSEDVADGEKGTNKSDATVKTGKEHKKALKPEKGSKVASTPRIPGTTGSGDHKCRADVGGKSTAISTTDEAAALKREALAPSQPDGKATARPANPPPELRLLPPAPPRYHRLRIELEPARASPASGTFPAEKEHEAELAQPVREEVAMITSTIRSCKIRELPESPCDLILELWNDLVEAENNEMLADAFWAMYDWSAPGADAHLQVMPLNAKMQIRAHLDAKADEAWRAMHEARAEAEAAAEGTVDASGAVTEHGRKREDIAAAASDLVENHLTNDESAGRANEHPSYDYPIDVKWTREGVEEILAAVGLQCSPLLQRDPNDANRLQNQEPRYLISCHGHFLIRHESVLEYKPKWMIGWDDLLLTSVKNRIFGKMLKRRLEGGYRGALDPSEAAASVLSEAVEAVGEARNCQDHSDEISTGEPEEPAGVIHGPALPQELYDPRQKSDAHACFRVRGVERPCFSAKVFKNVLNSSRATAARFRDLGINRMYESAVWVWTVRCEDWRWEVFAAGCAGTLEPGGWEERDLAMLPDTCVGDGGLWLDAGVPSPTRE